MKPNVTVLGWYHDDLGNVGDEAYKLAFPVIFPDVNLTFVNKLKPGHYDNVILGGGDVFNHYFLEYLQGVLGKKWAMSVNGTHPVLFRQNVALFEQVFFRAKSDDCLSCKVHVYPDFTFALKANQERGKALITQQFKDTGSDHYQKVVVVVINAYLLVKDNLLARDYLNFEKAAQDLARAFDQTNASFLFLPFTNGFPQNDRITNSVVYSRCKFWKKNSIWYKPVSVQDTLDICSGADLVLSSRLHGGIFAVIGGTPFIDLTHHTKTTGFLNFIRRSHWSVNYWQFDSERMTTMIKTMLEDKLERRRLEKIANDCRQKLAGVAAQVHFEK